MSKLYKVNICDNVYEFTREELKIILTPEAYKLVTKVNKQTGIITLDSGAINDIDFIENNL